MVATFLNILGWCLHKTPDRLLRIFCVLIGEAIFRFSGNRRRLALANLRHAFPEKSPGWRENILRESCRRMVEMALFVPASVWMSRDEIRRRFTLSPAARESFARLNSSDPRESASVYFVPHFTLAESLDLIPVLAEVPLDRIRVVFRPLDQPKLDRWVRDVRQRHGIRLLSRKDGFSETGQALSEGGAIAILFDQNASKAGSLITFFGRVASATELPGLLARRFRARPQLLYPHRTGFWRATFEVAPLEANSSIEPVIRAHRWLEKYLAESPDQCADWLWLHNRWRTQHRPRQRFRLDVPRSRRNHLETSCRIDGLETLPRKTPFLVRLPDNPAEARAAIPLLRALRAARPDFFLIALVTSSEIAKTVADPEAADEIRSLPADPEKRRQFFNELRDLHPETVLLLTENAASDREIACLRSPQVFGFQRPGKPRSVLTHPWPVPLELRDLPAPDLWEPMTRFYGLEEPIVNSVSGKTA